MSDNTPSNNREKPTEKSPPDPENNSLTQTEKEEWQELVEKEESELSDAEKTSKIKLSIKRRYDAPEWTVAFELMSPENRRADAIAVNTLASRNYKIVGFEFKASRNDWLSEKRDGEKADYFARICDEWYIVAWAGIVTEDELPDGWGLLELKPNSEQLWTIVESDMSGYQQESPGRPFWGRFLKKTVGSETNYTEQDLKEAQKRGYEEGKEDGKEYGSTIEDRRIKKKAERWDALEEAGLDWLYNVTEEDIQELRDARKLLHMLNEEGYKTIRSEFENLVDALNKFRAPLERLEKKANRESDSDSNLIIEEDDHPEQDNSNTNQ